MPAYNGDWIGAVQGSTVVGRESGQPGFPMGNNFNGLQTVATFIIQKILLDDNGLQYICATAERFYAVSTVLGNMVQSLSEAPSSRLLKHIIRCYQRLSENDRAREALRQCLPAELKLDAPANTTIANCLKEDVMARKWQVGLLVNLGMLPANSLQELVSGGRPMRVRAYCPTLHEKLQYGALSSIIEGVKEDYYGGSSR